ncbi:MAG TPA: c-type cytochrome domain-containing protein [Cytophagaceae bacterium]|jgi:hypothetical protein|nr:c-type cytochrome domain-containing protein [Cytophagaceae bacterium]
MKASFVKYIFLVNIIIISYSCVYHKGDQVNPEKDCANSIPDTVSFSRNVLPVFNTYCSTSGCHSGSSPSGNLNLESSQAYAQLMKRGSGYIDTSNPNNSVLYSSLISQSNPMPLNGRLDDCTINLIVKWMNQGAKNN